METREPAGRDVLDRLHFAKMIAFDAGKILMKFHGNLSGYDLKGKVDLVSEADRASEDYVKDRITTRFPDDAILAEESGASHGDSGYTWVIDPLDGTTNFVHGQPLFAVSLGLAGPTGLEMGVIYLPFLRELYAAARGRGAHGNNAPLTVSKTDTVDASLLATGFPYHRRDIIETLCEDIRRVVGNAQGMRRSGSACVDMAFVACGRADGFFERGLKPWDTAAGAVIIEEAGGRVTNFAGGPFDPHKPEVAASNGRIHDDLLRTLFRNREVHPE